MPPDNQFKFKKVSSQDAEENVLPLINIVFLLLIFFLWAGTISVPDLFEVAPPLSNNENPELGSELVVLIAKDGRYAFENNEISLNDLFPSIKDAVKNNPHQKFKIKADASIDTGKVINVMEILRNAGVINMTLITSKQT